MCMCVCVSECHCIAMCVMMVHVCIVELATCMTKVFSISETIFSGGAAINRAMVMYEQRVNYLIATVLLATNMVSCITEQLYRR